MTMSRLKLSAFAKDVEALMQEHQTHPGLILFQPNDGRDIFVLHMGSPSVEWISKAGTALMKKLEMQMPAGDLKGMK